eukprot:1083904-Amphidinium_carterae.1
MLSQPYGSSQQAQALKMFCCRRSLEVRLQYSQARTAELGEAGRTRSLTKELRDFGYDHVLKRTETSWSAEGLDVGGLPSFHPAKNGQARRRARHWVELMVSLAALGALGYTTEETKDTQTAIAVAQALSALPCSDRMPIDLSLCHLEFVLN